MADLIDRQKAINAVKRNAPYRYKHVENAILEDINVIPSVDAEPVRHGHWVYGEDEDGVDGYRCDKCGFFVPWDYTHKFINFIEDYNYCPHCNARMNEVNDG